MLKSLSAFLLLFWLLSVTVHAHVLADLFALGAVTLLLADVLPSLVRQNRSESRVRPQEFSTTVQ